MDDSNPCSWRAGLTALAGNKDTVGELFNGLFLAVSSSYMGVIHQGK